MTVEIYTDGACSPNPGSGGWGAILSYRGKRKEISGWQSDATNNQMELLAVIKALECLSRPCLHVEVYTDSQYVRNGITQWIHGWKKRGWKTGDGKPVKNKEMWIRLDALCSVHGVNFNWVRGHNGNPLNERADFLATSAINKH